MTDTAPPKRIDTIPSRPTIAFDWRDWLPYLADADMSLDQKKAYIETLQTLVLTFVDLGFDVKSPADICGKSIDLKAALETAVLNSRDAQTDTDPEEDAA